jgi:hypothetical protein
MKDPDAETESLVTRFLPIVVGVLDLMRLMLAAQGTR